MNGAHPRRLPVPYAAGVFHPVDGILQGEPLSPFLSLLKHARASVSWKVELLHHDVFGDAHLLPQVQPHWHRNTEGQRRSIRDLTQYPCTFPNSRFTLHHTGTHADTGCLTGVTSGHLKEGKLWGPLANFNVSSDLLVSVNSITADRRRYKTAKACAASLTPYFCTAFAWGPFSCCIVAQQSLK